jgi:hypothetical protein
MQQSFFGAVGLAVIAELKWTVLAETEVDLDSLRHDPAITAP